MKLISLTLDAFRQHRHTVLQLHEGLTGIIGPNGSGKTTLVEAIAFALFGSRAIRGKVEDALRRGAPKGSEPAVTLVFEHDGQTFRVERRGSEAAVYRGGEAAPLATGSRETSSLVSAVLGMSLEEFFATYFTEQKGLEFLSGQRGAAERERFILRMMGYDRFEKVQEVLRGERRDKKNAVAGWEAGLGNGEELEARRGKEAEKLQELEKALTEAAQALGRAEADFDKARKLFQQSEARASEHRVLEQRVRELKARLEERQKNASGLDREISSTEGKVGEALAELGLEKRASPAELLKALEAEFRALAERRDVAQQRVQGAESDWQRAKAEADADRRLARAHFESHRTKLRSLQNLHQEGDCPTCGQRLGGTFLAVLSGEERGLLPLEAALQQAEALVAKLAAEVPSVLSEARLARESVEKELAQMELRKSKLSRVAAESARFETLREQRVAVEKGLREVQQELLLAEREFGSHVFSEDVYRRDKGAFEASQGLVNVSRLQRVRIEGDLGTTQALLARTDQDIRSHDERVQSLEKVKEELLTLEETDLLLTDFRKYVNSSIRPRLAEIASEFITELTDGRYTAVEVGVDFSPTVIDEGAPKPIVSGGEEDILNLCMRLALSQMLAERAGHSFSLLVLDEVFGSLDEQRRLNVLLLLEKLSQRFEQILIITHLDDVKEGVRHLAYVDYDEADGEVHVEYQEAGAELFIGEETGNLLQVENG